MGRVAGDRLVVPLSACDTARSHRRLHSHAASVADGVRAAGGDLPRLGFNGARDPRPPFTRGRGYRAVAESHRPAEWQTLALPSPTWRGVAADPAAGLCSVRG